MTFKDYFDKLNWEEEKASIYQKTSWDVLKALSASKRTIEDFKALLSPAAEQYLEQMAQLSQQITQKRFGKTIQLFAPLYLSNECNNICTYCGFSFENKIPRKTLSEQEILTEIKALKKHSFNHILLVTGEDNHKVNLSYFLKAIELIKPHFSNISIEVQPLKSEEYQALKQAGVYAVLIYQETYHKEQYANYHLKGKKSNFYNRILTPDYIGQAEIHKIGLGVLLGLEDWRTDSLFCAYHLAYLEKAYWQTKYAISFPRIRPAQGSIEPVCEVSDKNLLQLICAYRIWNEEVELSISTRESEKFRNHIFKLGITSMSAGSKTNPGGYSVEPESLKQFEISDERSPEEISRLLTENQYEPVWKDWDRAFIK